MFRDQIFLVIIFLDFYIALMPSQPTRRATPGSILASTYFQNTSVETCLFLEEINVKEGYELDRFFSKMTKSIGNFYFNFNLIFIFDFIFDFILILFCFYFVLFFFLKLVFPTNLLKIN